MGKHTNKLNSYIYYVQDHSFKRNASGDVGEARAWEKAGDRPVQYMHARTHTHTHTHTPHRAFHPQRQPALPGTQSLAEPGREREGLAERILRNSGPVNTSFGDLIRPPPGQQQAGEKADNGRHGDWTHPGMPSSFWNKRSSARPGWEEGLWYYLPQTSQHRWVSL